MGLTPFKFTKDWTEPNDFPVVVEDTSVARKNIQLLHTETKNFINQTLIPFLDGLKREETSDKQALADHKTDPAAHTELFTRKADKTALETHEANRENPHNVTVDQIGAQPSITGPEGSVVQILPGGGVGGGVTVPELADQIAGLLPEQLLPRGMVLLWSGSKDAIPAGWVLCDGKNGTPDLTDRFVVGAGRSYSVGATGGENKHALTVNEMPSHGHSGSASLSGTTNSAGSHTHGLSFWNGYSGSYYATSGSTDRTGSYTIIGSTREQYRSEARIEEAGSHSHSVSLSGSVSVDAVGGSVAHENRPPYYALCYIMKI